MRKIPVWKTIAEGYSFTFGQLGTIIGLIWLPMVIVAMGGYFVMSQYYNVIPSAIEQGNPAAAGQALAAVVMWSVVWLLLYSIMYAAVTRQVLGLRHGSAWINFRFGLTEFRVFGALAALFAILVFLGLAYLFVLGLAAGAAKSAGAVTGLLAVIALGALIFLMVRLSFLVVPATVAEDAIGLMRSWQLTGGNFWRIVLIGLITLGPLLIVYTAAELAILGPDFFMSHNIPAGDADAQLKAMVAQMRAASPHIPVISGFTFLIAPLMIGLSMAPSAFAYLALTKPGPTN